MASGWGRSTRSALIVFICEYTARIWAAPEHPLLASKGPLVARLRVVFLPMMIVDFISILPFFIEIFTGANVAAIRIIRIVRFYRLARYVPAIATIGRVLANEWRSLVGCGAIFAGLLLLASVAMYLAEGKLQPENFGDVPSAMWWAVVTLSTVGYGDVTPITALGRVIAGFVMVMGIAFFALPVGIIANGFQQEIKQSDFVVSFAMVARVPLFARLETTLIARLVRLLHARKFAANTIDRVKRARLPTAMFFIANGEVEIELAQQSGAPRRGRLLRRNGVARPRCEANGDGIGRAPYRTFGARVPPISAACWHRTRNCTTSSPKSPSSGAATRRSD